MLQKAVSRDWKDGKIHLQRTYLIKNCNPKYTKKFWKLNHKKTKNGLKILTDTSPKKIYRIQMANKHMKRCFTSYIIREMQIKMRYHTRIRMTKIQNTDITCWRGCEATGEWNVVQPLWKTVWQFLNKAKYTLTIQYSNHASWYVPKGVKNICSHKTLYTDVNSRFMHNCQNLKASQMFFSRWMDRQIVVLDTAIPFSAKKKWATKPWKDLKEI